MIANGESNEVDLLCLMKGNASTIMPIKSNKQTINPKQTGAAERTRTHAYLIDRDGQWWQLCGGGDQQLSATRGLDTPATQNESDAVRESGTGKSPLRPPTAMPRGWSANRSWWWGWTHPAK